MSIQSETARSPKLRFPEFVCEWEEKRLGDILTFKNGVNADKSMYGFGYKYINVLDIIDSRPITSSKINSRVSISEKEFKKNEVVFGDILFQRSSETRREVGQSNVYLDRDNTVTFGGFVIRGKPITDFNPQYFDALLKTSKVRKDVTTRSGGSTRYNVGQASLSDVSIHIAPVLAEQQKIATFLTSVDSKIEKLIKKQELLSEYKKGLVQKIFSQELRFKTDDGSNYPDWEEKKLEDVAKFRRGSFPQPYGLSKWYDKENGKPFIQVFDVDNNMKLKSLTKNKISKVAEPLSVFVEKGNVILTIQGSIGRIALTQYDSYVDRTLLIFTEYLVSVDKNYFVYAIFLLFEIEKRKAPGGTIKTITKETLKKFVIQLPNINEQIKISNLLCSIDSKIEQIGKQLDATKQFKKALLQQMFV
jgi:type I restriction enzyme, S subunit